MKDYIPEIRKLHNENAIQNSTKISYRINKWIKQQNIIIYVASNEQKPWENLQYNTYPMLRKEDIGYKQVGDYQAYIKSINTFVPLLVERKTVADLYGTLMQTENRQRFYKEINTFEADHRFNQFVLIAECSYNQFLKYKPKFQGIKLNTKKYGATVDAKRGSISSLISRGIITIFAGSRLQARKLYVSMIKQSIIKNYPELVLGE